MHVIGSLFLALCPQNQDISADNFVEKTFDCLQSTSVHNSARSLAKKTKVADLERDYEVIYHLIFMYFHARDF